MRKRRSPVVAAVLSLALPGLGQLYNAQTIKGVAFLGVGAVLSAVLRLTPLRASVSGLVVALSIAVALAAVAAVEAALAARRLGVIELGRLTRWYVHLIVFVGCAALSAAADRVARASPGRYDSYSTPANSMLPTLDIGDVFWTGPVGLTGGTIRRAEIVVFQAPGDLSKDFVKRVVGLAGDVVELREGRLVINDRPVDRCDLGEYRYPEIDGLTGAVSERTGRLCLEHLDGRTYRVLDTGQEESWGPEQVAPGHVFVLGDNRGNSHDSRHFGGVPLENVGARALFGLYSRPPVGGLSLGRTGHPLDDLEAIEQSRGAQLRRCRAEGFPR